jgi:hypothetical protein
MAYSGYLSHALTGLQSAGTNPNPVHTAMIAGQATTGNAGNFAQLGVTTFSSSWFLPRLCPGGGVPGALTTAGWPTLFPVVNGVLDPSDAIVNITSQRNGQTSGPAANNVIDTTALIQLNFVGPAELDSNSATGIPSLVMQLLNTPPTQDYGFYLLY